MHHLRSSREPSLSSSRSDGKIDAAASTCSDMGSGASSSSGEPPAREVRFQLTSHEESDSAVIEQQSMSSSDPNEWLQAVRERQMTRMTPEQAAEVQERKRQFRARRMTPKREQLSKRAARISSCSSMSRASWVGSSRAHAEVFSSPQYRSCGALSMEDEASMEATLSRNSGATMQLQALMASPATSAAGALSITDEVWEAQEEAVRSAGGFTEADAVVDHNELDTLLKELEIEPSIDKECAAKFKLYEQYSETVSAVRKATLDFWEEAASEFPEGCAKARIYN